MIKIAVGDCLERMREFESESVHCCVTSPPYFGLRDYGHEGQIGLEESPEQFVSKLVEVFREVRRLLRDDGTLWLNLGDSYAGGGGGNYSKGTRNNSGQNITNVRNRPDWLASTGLKPKDLIGIPWRVAFALQADGWYLRQDIIWSKPNPMPESVTDRCTKAHEYLFLLSKSPRYWFDAEAIKEEGSGRIPGNKKPIAKRGASVETAAEGSGIFAAQQRACETRNRRSVWTVATRPYKGAHFATFPPDLIEPCVLAGCPEGGIVLDPFGGAGTTGLVAQRLERSAILCELNPEYALLAENRIREDSPMFSCVERC